MLNIFQQTHEADHVEKCEPIYTLQPLLNTFPTINKHLALTCNGDQGKTIYGVGRSGLDSPLTTLYHIL